MIARQTDYETLLDSQYDDEAVLYYDALICLQEAEILSGSENEDDRIEAGHLVKVAVELIDNICSFGIETLLLRARTLEEKLDIN